MVAMKLVALFVVLAWCSAFAQEDPESAKLQAQKARKLAPYNSGNGVACGRVNPTKADTCIYKGSFCGYFCECPKCVCIKEGFVGVELPDGTRECRQGNVGWFDASIAADSQPTCKVSAQCKSNLKCVPFGTDLTMRCVCPAGHAWDTDQEKCVPPFKQGEACDPSVNCGYGAGTTNPDSKIGHYCEQDPGSTTDNAGNALTTEANKCYECISNCRSCDRKEQCIKCEDGFKLEPGTPDQCLACMAPNCKRCDSQSSTPSGGFHTCDECNDDYFKDSTNQYTCTQKVEYQKPCKGENNECKTMGAECRAVNGVNMCTCKAGYTWNPSGGFCVHPDANLNVEVNRTCKYDRENWNNAGNFKNDGTLQICKAGLECVDSCSPCAGCGGVKVCVTKLEYSTPPCTRSMQQWTSGGGSNVNHNSGAGGGGGRSSSGTNSGNNNSKNAAHPTRIANLVAILGSVALAAFL